MLTASGVDPEVRPAFARAPPAEAGKGAPSPRTQQRWRVRDQSLPERVPRAAEDARGALSPGVPGARLGGAEGSCETAGPHGREVGSGTSSSRGAPSNSATAPLVSGGRRTLGQVSDPVVLGTGQASELVSVVSRGSRRRAPPWCPRVVQGAGAGPGRRASRAAASAVVSQPLRTRTAQTPDDVKTRAL